MKDFALDNRDETISSRLLFHAFQQDPLFFKLNAIIFD